MEIVVAGNGTSKSSKARTDRRSDQKVQVVYFLHVVSANQPCIKIGESTEYQKRLKEHRKPKHGITFDVRELCVVRGARSDEQAVHKYFHFCNLPGGEEELFSLHEELVDYIRWLRDQYFVWVPDCECPSLENLDTVGSELWLPKAERRKAAPKQAGLFQEFGDLVLPPREVTIDDFYTSPLILSAARQAMGGIDLDPASHAVANQKVQATAFFTKNDDGLSREWGGRVWLNPPFSQWQSWVTKIVGEWNTGRVQSMCILCATRTLTAQYFSPIHETCAAICILRGRIPFWGGLAGSPDDGHAVLYFGKDKAAFRESFSVIGNVYERPV